MRRAAAIVLAATFLAAGAAPAGEYGHGSLARRGADDSTEHREGEHRGGREGIDTATAGADQDAKALFERKCSACHPLSRSLSRNRERKWWVETVTRMQKVNGCNITDAEAEAIVDYLAKVRGPEAK